MIKTTFNLSIYGSIKPIKDSNVFAMPIPPLERVKSFSPEAFEAFIAEWAIACVKPVYKDVYRIGGAGDKGRDVISEYENGDYDYFQCKRYDKKLMPSEYWIEFGKLCYYTFNKDIPLPRKYYIIASQGLGSKMLALIKDPESIRKGLKEYWEDKCETNIVKGTLIKLEGSLLKYINNFNFRIVDYYSIEKIIEEHRTTNYFYFRFGGNLKPIRTITVLPPTGIEQIEIKYITKIFDAYSDYKKMCVKMEALKTFPDLLKDFDRQRSNFYSAESLKRCIRDIFTNENEFENLMNEMYSGIVDFIEGDFNNGYDKLKKTMHEATKVNLSVSVVDRDLHFVGNDDKKGICHHLANEGELNWRDET